MEVIECPGSKTAMERNSVIGLKVWGAEVIDDFGSCPSAPKKLDFVLYMKWGRMRQYIGVRRKRFISTPLYNVGSTV